MWTEDEKELLNEMKRQCLIHLQLQTYSAFFNHIIYNTLVIPNIIVGGVLSISLFSTNTEGPWKTAKGILAITSTIFSTLTRQLGSGEKAQLHCTVARQYQILIRNINTHLCLTSSLDSNKSIIIQNVKSEMDRLLEISPNPSYLVTWRMQKRNSGFVDVVSMEVPMMVMTNTIHQRISQYTKISNDVLAYTYKKSLRSHQINSIEDHSYRAV
jgi:hypothetical protein